MQPPARIDALSPCGHCVTKRLPNEWKVQYNYFDLDPMAGDDQEAVIKEVPRLKERLDCSIIFLATK